MTEIGEEAAKPPRDQTDISHGLNPLGRFFDLSSLIFATENLCLAEFVLKTLFGIGQIKYSDQVITPRTTEFPAADQK